MAQNEFALTRQYVNEVVDRRAFGARIAQLAFDMAKQAGEPVTRPLSQAQVERAVLANGVETTLAMDALITRLETMYREGKLPEDAGLPVW